MAADQVYWMVIHPDESFQVHTTKPTLEELQEAVGDGPIEAVGNMFPVPFTAYCHEEGKLKGLPFNPVATALCLADMLVGSVVFIGLPDDKGENTRLQDDVMTNILFVLGQE